MSQVKSGSWLLIVDDDISIRRTLRMILSEEGFNIQEAGNGQEALDLLAKGDLPFLIFLDIRMPVMDGIQFRKEQLMNEQLKHIPTVIMSANTNLINNSDDLQVEKILPKPAELEDIISVVEYYSSYIN